jgi:hypothetical protein
MIVNRMSLAPQYIDKERFDLELVTCSGRGKNGALCVLQRGVRPQVLGSFHLSGKRAMWTVHARKSAGMYGGCSRQELLCEDFRAVGRVSLALDLPPALRVVFLAEGRRVLGG